MLLFLVVVVVVKREIIKSSVIRNVSIVSLFSDFFVTLKSLQFYPITSGEITLLNALFLITQTRTPPPTRRPTMIKRSQEQEQTFIL